MSISGDGWVPGGALVLVCPGPGHGFVAPPGPTELRVRVEVTALRRGGEIPTSPGSVDLSPSWEPLFWVVGLGAS